MIDKIIEKQKRNKSETNNISIKRKKTYIPAHYIDDNSQKLARTFAKYDYQLAFRTSNDIYNNLKISNTKKKSIYEKAGIYRYQCQSAHSTEYNVQCNKKYIGFTSRSFEHRYIGHTGHSQYSNPNSIVANT